MVRIMESESKPLRNIILRMITLKSNTSDRLRMFWYACCCELVRAKRTPDGERLVYWQPWQTESCAVVNGTCWMSRKLLDVTQSPLDGIDTATCHVGTLFYYVVSDSVEACQVSCTVHASYLLCLKSEVHQKVITELHGQKGYAGFQAVPLTAT
jgi:hypothetical protein